MLKAMSWLQAFILAVVEGLTEYLPISSTGHLIIASAAMGIADHPFTKDFTVIVQFGAILSVLVVYWRRFLTSWNLYAKLFIGFLPAAVIGFAIKNHVDALLGSVTVVAVAMIIGGVVLLFIDRWFAHQEARLTASNEGTIEKLTYLQSLAIGFIQCVAFIPGVSRSAATIIGGLGLKLTRQSAAEFSFLLAVPTLSAATAWKLLKVYKTIEPGQIGVILFGNLVSFIVGWITIKAFLGFLTKRGFLVFGIYRIVFGAILLAMIFAGYELKLL